jgi:hypothetical protein
MIHEKKHFMKNCRAGGGRGFYCSCCFSPQRKKRKAFMRQMRHTYNQQMSKLVQQELD